MASYHNGFFTRMMEEAMNEVASGDKGWKEQDTNTLVLACFGYLTNHVLHMITKPMWAFSSAVVLGVAFYIVKGIFDF